MHSARWDHSRWSRIILDKCCKLHVYVLLKCLCFGLWFVNYFMGYNCAENIDKRYKCHCHCILIFCTLPLTLTQVFVKSEQPQISPSCSIPNAQNMFEMSIYLFLSFSYSRNHHKSNSWTWYCFIDQLQVCVTSSDNGIGCWRRGRERWLRLVEIFSGNLTVERSES